MHDEQLSALELSLFILVKSLLLLTHKRYFNQPPFGVYYILVLIVFLKYNSDALLLSSALSTEVYRLVFDFIVKLLNHRLATP